MSISDRPDAGQVVPTSQDRASAADSSSLDNAPNFPSSSSSETREPISRVRRQGSTSKADGAAFAPARISAADLDDRQIRGTKLARDVAEGKAKVAMLNEDSVIYMSTRKDQIRAYEVVREERNIRGDLAVVYRCSCSDFKKHGRIDCPQIFAERLRRNEVLIDGTPDTERAKRASAPRRPARKQPTISGRSHRTVQREARKKMPARIRELIPMLVAEYDRNHPRSEIRKRGGQAYPAPLRAASLVFKIVNGLSADAMIEEYERLINDGVLKLRNAPSQNTLTEWMNDPELMPILEYFLYTTAKPYRAAECSAIIDSSKISQQMNAHSRFVDYEGDEREHADWMKCHVAIGAESSIVMAVKFAGTLGKGTHDINFLKPLVEHASKTFDLKHVLADKAYLSEEVVGWLYDRGVKAIIRVKKKWDAETKATHHVACLNLVKWYDERQRDFHEAFRFRVKIEALFSHLKRLSDGYCWSRGRKRTVTNAAEPCVAWINELLCKFIFINLRITVTREEMTGVRISYLIDDRFFPAPIEQLIA